MSYARLCEHGEVKAHPVTKVRPYLTGEGIGDWVIPRSSCPGGSVLPDDTIVLVREDVEPIIACEIAGYHMTVGDAVEAAVRILDALAAAQGSQE